MLCCVFFWFFVQRVCFFFFGKFFLFFFNFIVFLNHLKVPGFAQMVLFLRKSTKKLLFIRYVFKVMFIGL